MINYKARGSVPLNIKWKPAKRIFISCKFYHYAAGTSIKIINQPYRAGDDLILVILHLDCSSFHNNVGIVSQQKNPDPVFASNGT